MQKLMEACAWSVFMNRLGSGPCCFRFHGIVTISLTWPPLTTEKATKCRFVVFPEEKERPESGEQLVVRICLVKGRRTRGKEGRLLRSQRRDDASLFSMLTGPSDHPTGCEACTWVAGFSVYLGLVFPKIASSRNSEVFSNSNFRE